MTRILVSVLCLLLVGLGAACSETDTPRVQTTASATTPATGQATGTATPSTAARTATATASPAGGRAATNTIDPCRVATKQEIEAAVGVSLSDGELHRSAIDVCIYEEQSSRTVPTRVYLYAMRGASARAFYDDARKQDSRATDVSGLGDQAFLGSSGSALTAVRGEVFISIDVNNGPPGSSTAEAREKLVGLMRTILSRV